LTNLDSGLFWPESRKGPVAGVRSTLFTRLPLSTAPESPQYRKVQGVTVCRSLPLEDRPVALRQDQIPAARTRADHCRLQNLGCCRIWSIDKYCTRGISMSNIFQKTSGDKSAQTPGRADQDAHQYGRHLARIDLGSIEPGIEIIGKDRPQKNEHLENCNRWTTGIR
jgi:hypothetical protein